MCMSSGSSLVLLHIKKTRNLYHPMFFCTRNKEYILSAYLTPPMCSSFQNKVKKSVDQDTLHNRLIAESLMISH